MFGGLLAQWNLYAPQQIPEEVLTFVRDCVVLNRYRLRTELVEFSGGRRGKVGGFIGRCRFSLRCPDPEYGRQVALLTQYASLAGVGWRTTMGLG